MTNQEIALKIALKLTGARKRDVLGRSKCRAAIECRMLVIHALKREGLTNEALSWALHVDTSSVTRLHGRSKEELRTSVVFESKAEEMIEKYEEAKLARQATYDQTNKRTR